MSARTARRRSDRSGFTVALIIVAVLAINSGVLLAIKAAFPNLAIFPQGKAAAAAPPAPPAPAKIAALSGKVPAEVALDAVFARGPGSLPAAGGWRPSTAPPGASGTPFDYPCGIPGGPAPVVSKVRGFVQASGPHPGDVKASVSVSMRAYAAGQGGAALDALKENIRKCRGASAYSRSGVGVQALLATNAQTSNLIWRRGDVLGLVSFQTGGRAGNIGTVNPVVGEYDTRLIQALAGVCVETDSEVRDAARSPYVNPAAFTGLTLARPVGMPTPVDGKLPDGSVAPQVPALVPLPFPQPALDTPRVPELPRRPADPVTPAQAPEPRQRPEPPTVPSPAPTATQVPERVQDKTGPGCGWAFTGQIPPKFDQAKATAELKAAESKAQVALFAGKIAYINAQNGYQTQYGAYKQQVEEFSAYAAEVQRTRDSWLKIQQERDTYYWRLEQYNDAVRDRERFLQNQKEAQLRYEAAIEACRVEAAKPKPKPSPTASPTPVVIASPKPGEPVPPSPAPTASPEATASPTPTIVCPPNRPRILDQAPPEVPAPPVPPSHLPK